MKRYRTGLALTLSAAFAIALPAAGTAQITANRPVQRPEPPKWSPGQPAYAVDQFRSDRLDKIRTLIAEGEFQKARMALDGRRNDSRSPEGEYLLGVVSSNLGNYQAASEAFASSLTLDRSHIGSSVGLALTDLKLGRRDRAEDIARALEARRASCANDCSDAAALDRASTVLQHFLARA